MLKDKLAELLELLEVREDAEQEIDIILEEVSQHYGVDFDTLKKLIDMDRLIESVISGVLGVFTEGELDAAIKFMRSKEGESFAKKMEQFSEVANSISSMYLTDLLDDFFSANTDEVDDDDSNSSGSNGAGGYTN